MSTTSNVVRSAAPSSRVDAFPRGAAARTDERQVRARDDTRTHGEDIPAVAEWTGREQP